MTAPRASSGAIVANKHRELLIKVDGIRFKLSKVADAQLADSQLGIIEAHNDLHKLLLMTGERNPYAEFE